MRPLREVSCRGSQYDDLSPELNRIVDNKATWLAAIKHEVRCVKLTTAWVESICLTINEDPKVNGLPAWEDYLQRLGVKDSIQFCILPD
jgi:hypothetical protein